MQLTPFKFHAIVISKIETKISLSVMTPQKNQLQTQKSGEMFYIPRFLWLRTTLWDGGRML